jgi:hypothetical protein
MMNNVQQYSCSVELALKSKMSSVWTLLVELSWVCVI